MNVLLRWSWTVRSGVGEPRHKTQRDDRRKPCRTLPEPLPDEKEEHGGDNRDAGRANQDGRGRNQGGTHKPAPLMARESETARWATTTAASCASMNTHSDITVDVARKTSAGVVATAAAAHAER